MSVDGIGSGGRNVGGVGRGEAPLAPAPTEGAAAGHSIGPAASGGPTPLERLEKGEISFDQYLDGRVADAVRHLEGRASGAQIDFLRQALRESMAADPVLAELVRRATGSVPSQGAD